MLTFTSFGKPTAFSLAAAVPEGEMTVLDDISVLGELHKTVVLVQRDFGASSERPGNRQ